MPPKSQMPPKNQLVRLIITEKRQVAEVANSLGCSERALYRYMAHYGIKCGNRRHEHNKGGRPVSRIPVRLRTAMRDAGLAVRWQTLADLFDCSYNNARKIVYDRKYETVRQFLHAAAVLRISPRDLLEIIDNAQREKGNWQTTLQTEWLTNSTPPGMTTTPRVVMNRKA